MANWYKSIRELCRIENLTREFVIAAKVHPDCPPQAWEKGTARVNWDHLKPFIESHKDEIQKVVDSGDTNSLQELKVIEKKLDIRLKQIEVDEAEGKYVLRTDVMNTISAIAQAQASLLKTKLVNELPPKIVGCDVPIITTKMEDTLKEVVNLMRNIEL